jgi:hypothetical protein
VKSEGYQDNTNFSCDDEVGAGSGTTRHLKNLDCIANAVDEPPKMHLIFINLQRTTQGIACRVLNETRLNDLLT